MGPLATATFEGRGLDGEILKVDACSGPVLFDPTWDFRVLALGSVDVVIYAFQDAGRSKLEPKLAGRLKSLGCSVDNPGAWRVPRRVSLDGKARFDTHTPCILAWARRD